MITKLRTQAVYVEDQEKALGFYEELLRVEPDDPLVKWEAARAARRVGDIYRLLGRYPEALTAYDQAADRLRRLPPGPGPRQEVALCHNYRGEVYRLTERPDEADAEYRQAIVIQLEHGTYYSLAEAAACVWDAVVRGGPAADAVAAVVAGYDVTAEIAAPAVVALLDALVEEGLAAVDEAPSLPLPVVPSPGEARRPWAPPELVRFTDMQELLLADPIHEVADAGWPHVKPVVR